MKLKDVIRKSNLVNSLLSAEEFAEAGQSKLKYAINKNNSRVVPISDKHGEDVKDLKSDHASVDDRGNLIVSEETGNYSYTPANEKLLRTKIAELLEKDVTFEPYLFMHESELKEPIDEFLREELEGFFFPAKTQEKTIEQGSE